MITAKKTKIPFFIPLLFISFFFFSCNKSEPNNLDPIKSDITFPEKKAIKNNEFSESLKSNFSITKEGLKASNKKPDNLYLDLDNVYEIKNVNSSKNKSIFVEGKLNGNNIALFKEINEKGDLSTDFFICETNKKNDDLYIVNYYNSNYEKVNSITIIPSKNQILTRKYTDNNIAGIKANTNIAKDRGQDVADCISDAYSNHGWVSAWAFVQTAFIPATAVAIAGACVGLNW